MFVVPDLGIRNRFGPRGLRQAIVVPTPPQVLVHEVPGLFLCDKKTHSGFPLSAFAILRQSTAIGEIERCGVQHSTAPLCHHTTNSSGHAKAPHASLLWTVLGDETPTRGLLEGALPHALAANLHSNSCVPLSLMGC